mgnify:CR=1 FL=1
MREDDPETSGVRIPSINFKPIESCVSEPLGRIFTRFPMGFFAPDVSGSSSLTSGTLAMFLGVLKTYGDVFSRFVKFCVALQIPAAHQVDDVILCYKML